MEQKAAFCDLPGGRCAESSRNERITPAFCFSRGWAQRRDTLVDGPAEVAMPGRAGMPPGGGFLWGAAGRPRGSGKVNRDAVTESGKRLSRSAGACGLP